MLQKISGNHTFWTQISGSKHHFRKNMWLKNSRVCLKSIVYVLEFSSVQKGRGLVVNNFLREGVCLKVSGRKLSIEKTLEARFMGARESVQTMCSQGGDQKRHHPLYIKEKFLKICHFRKNVLKTFSLDF